MTHKRANKAIVIGGSIAGLSTVKAIAPYFEQIILVERDAHPNSYNPRKAIPQGYHAHALLKGGELALNKLFPGLTEDLINCGAKHIDISEDVRWYHAGVWKIRYDSGLKVVLQSRPLLEQVIRERIHRLDNVEFCYGYQVENLNLSDDNKTVIGVTLRNMEDRSDLRDMTADLVIDASGRGSKMPQWLEQAGFSAPEETSLRIDLSYSTRMYRAPEGFTKDWGLMLINPQAPDILRAGYVFPVENNHVLITLGGYSGDTTPKDNDSFAEYAKNLAQPDIYNVIQELEPVNDVKYHSVPQTRRRHYEKLNDMPDGLMVIGDASCAFDPVFGQGMSAAAMSAHALSEMFSTMTTDEFATSGKQFQKKASKITDVPWLLSSTEDFRYPATVGEKSVIVPFMHRYTTQIFELSATDETVFEAFANVMQLQASAETLFKPAIVWKVLKHALTK